MGIIELLIIAVGVSMDALAVSICKGLSIKKISPKYMYRTAIWFGGFQALMPLIGYFVGIHFADFVANVDHWIAFVLLALIGSNMIKESLNLFMDAFCNRNNSILGISVFYKNLYLLIYRTTCFHHILLLCDKTMVIEKINLCLYNKI